MFCWLGFEEDGGLKKYKNNKEKMESKIKGKWYEILFIFWFCFFIV